MTSVAMHTMSIEAQPSQRIFLAVIFCILVGPFQFTVSQSPTVCPSDMTYCTSQLASPTVIVETTCSGFGSVPNLPPSCRDSRTLTELTITNSTVLHIQAEAFSGLQINSLILSSLGITSLDNASFSGLGSYLQTLQLDGNFLTILPSQVFTTLVSLRYLLLQNNNLVELPLGCFNTLTSLQYLNLANNMISFLDPSTFQMTVPLLQLQLQNNHIQNISATLFSKLPLLTTLRLDSNKIESLSGSTFSALAQLQTINLSSNAIVLLPGGLFTANSQVQYIDVSNNAITEIDINCFRGLANLETLLLNDNHISAIPGNLFYGMNQINVLNLTSNSLIIISSDSWSGMPFLTQLYLRNNYISTLPVGVFDPLGALKTLDLSDNQISTISLNPFTATIHLTTVDLSENNLTHIRRDFFTTTSVLTTLLLSNNLITQIDASTFNATPALTVLDLSYNNLSVDSLSGVFEFGGIQAPLQTLWLTGNPLTTVRDNTFSALTQLTTLYLNYTCLSNVSFGSPLSLQQLYLSHNFIAHIQASAFIGLAQLNTLDLGSNDIASIDEGAIAILPQLRLLNLTDNSVGNSAVTMSSSALVSSSSCAVDLSWNDVTSLAGLQRFGVVYLAGNPLACGCLDQLAWLANATLTTAWPDYDATACNSGITSVTPRGTTESLYVSTACYFANSTQCPLSANLIGSSFNCSGNESYSAAPVKPSRMSDLQQCGLYVSPTTPSYISSSNSLSTPTLTDLVVTTTNWSLTAQWTLQGSTTTVKSVEVTVDETTATTVAAPGGSTLPTPTTEIDEQVSTTDKSVTVTLPSGGCYLVCVRTVLNTAAVTSAFSSSSTTVTTTTTSTTSTTLAGPTTISTSSSATPTTSVNTPTATSAQVAPTTTTTAATTTQGAAAAITTSASNGGSTYGPTLCMNVTVLPLACDETTRTWPQCAASKSSSTPDWLIIAVVVGAGGGLILILLVIIIVAIVKCRRNKVRDTKGSIENGRTVTLKPSESSASRVVDGSDFRSSMAEQLTVDVDYFDTNTRY